MAQYDHVLFDLDGTLLLDADALPGAAGAVAAARGAGCGVGVLTNDPVHSRDEQSARLAAAGIDVAASAIVTSGRALAGLAAAEHPGAQVLALGSPAFLRECREHGLLPVEDVADARVVLLGGSRDFSYADLTRVVRAALLHDLEVIGSNGDATFPAAGGPAPGAGALLASVSFATGRPVRCAGKPEPAMFEEARRALGSGRCLVVGDRLDSDIAGGAAAGMDTALVLSGSTSDADVAAWTGAPPTYVLPGVGALDGLLEGRAA